MYSYNKRYIFLILICFLIVLTSCGGNAPQKPSGQDENEEEKQSQIQSIEEDIEKIFKALNGPTLVIEGESQQQDSQQQSPEDEKQSAKESETGSQKGPQEGQQQDGQNQKSETQKGGSQQQQQQNPWDQINTALNSLHKKWNDYAPEAAKMGASSQMMEGFSNSLNDLTKQVLTKDILKIMGPANLLYSYTSDFSAMYKSKMPVGIKKIAFYARNAIIKGSTGAWEEADNDISNLKSLWNIVKNSIDKDKQELSGKLELSIMELEKVVKDRSQALTDLKGRIVLSNISGILKTYKNSQQ